MSERCGYLVSTARAAAAFVVISALSAVSASVHAQEDALRRDWLLQHANPIRTLSFADTDDQDLSPLGRAIAGRRIVLLGEQSHGDGAAFLAKARIIRYLHERLGFDLIVFESGFYECRRTWQDVRNGLSLSDVATAEGCMFTLWANSEQLRPLFEYMEAQKSRRMPLELAGMDFSPSGTAAGRFLNDLAAFLRAQPDTAGVATALATLHATYGTMFSGEGTPPARNMGQAARKLSALPDTSRRAMLEAFTALRRNVARDIGALGALGEAAFWRQALESQRALAEVAPKLLPDFPQDVVNRRDAVMAENLAWLVRQNPRRKVVVWAATSHLIRNRRGIEGDQAPGLIPTGHLIAEAFPDDVYTIGFVAADGEIAQALPGPDRERTRQPVRPPPEGSIDALLRDTGHEFAFLDLRTPRPGGEWLQEPLVARPLGYGRTTARWPTHLDAFVFTRTMTPSTPRTVGR